MAKLMAGVDKPRGALSRFDLYVALALAVVAFAVTVAVTLPRRSPVTGVAAVIEPSRKPPAPAVTQPAPVAPVLPQPTQAAAPAAFVPQPRPAARSVEPALPEAPKLPPLPVRVTFPSRGAARAIQIVATGSADEPLSVEVEVSNEATGKQDQHSISLNPPKMVTLGQADGADVQQGDAIKIHAAGYADVIRRIL